MKNVKGWDEEEDDYALFTSHTNKKKYKKQFKGRCSYCGEYGHKAVDYPNKKSNQNKGSKKKSEQKKTHGTKGEYNRKGYKDMSKIKCYNCGQYGHYDHDCPKPHDNAKIKCYNCGQYGHYDHDCPKPHDNANIVQENEQNKELENMMDLDDNSVNKECAMVCTDVQHEDLDENIVVYSDQGVSTEEHDKAMYAESIETDSEN